MIVRWKHALWPTLFLSTIAYIYLRFISEYKTVPDTANGMAFVVTIIIFVLVTTVTSIVGSIFTPAEEAPTDHIASATACTHCGTTEGPLVLVQYEYGIFLVIVFLQRSIYAKLCRSCAVPLLNKAFIATIIGCMLFPPLILYNAFRRYRILRQFNK